jgi:hypothetical protein
MKGSKGTPLLFLVIFFLTMNLDYTLSVLHLESSGSFNPPLTTTIYLLLNIIFLGFFFVYFFNSFAPSFFQLISTSLKEGMEGIIFYFHTFQCYCIVFICMIHHKNKNPYFLGLFCHVSTVYFGQSFISSNALHLI